MSSQPYYPPPPTSDYPANYPADSPYASGALTTTHRPPSGAYYPPDGSPRPDFRNSDRDRHQLSRHHYSKDDGRDYVAEERYSRRHKSRERSRSRSRSRSKSRIKEVGVTAAGGAAGAFLGREFGKGSTIATLGGLAAGAWGAHELERKYEKSREKKRFEQDGYSYGGGDRPKSLRRRSSTNLIDGIKDKLGGLITEFENGAKEKEKKRRSRSHVEGSRRRDYGSDTDSDDGRYEYERTERRYRPRRDDY